jgi:hypothetical protein
MADKGSLMLNLGFMTMTSSMLENVLNGAIWRLAGIEAFNGFIITDRMSASRKLDVIRALIHLRFAAATAPFKTLDRRLSAAINNRNRFRAWLLGRWLNTDDSQAGIYSDERETQSPRC